MSSWSLDRPECGSSYREEGDEDCAILYNSVMPLQQCWQALAPLRFFPVFFFIAGVTMKEELGFLQRILENGYPSSLCPISI